MDAGLTPWAPGVLTSPCCIRPTLHAPHTSAPACIVMVWPPTAVSGPPHTWHGPTSTASLRSTTRMRGLPGTGLLLGKVGSSAITRDGRARVGTRTALAPAVHGAAMLVVHVRLAPTC